MTDTILMPKELTAENGAKSLLIGEFKEQTLVRCPDCTEEIDQEDCVTCDGTQELYQDVVVSWSTIKDIYKMAVDNLAIETEKPVRKESQL